MFATRKSEVEWRPGPNCVFPGNEDNFENHRAATFPSQAGAAFPACASDEIPTTPAGSFVECRRKHHDPSPGAPETSEPTGRGFRASAYVVLPSIPDYFVAPAASPSRGGNSKVTLPISSMTR